MSDAHWFMRISFLVVLLLSVSCGGGSATDAIEGTWTLDPGMMKETEEYKNASEAEQKLMEGMLSAMKMEVTFTADTVTMDVDIMGQKKSDSSPYTVVSSDGDTLVLESDKDGEKERVTVRKMGDRLEFQSGGDKFTLKRK